MVSHRQAGSRAPVEAAGLGVGWFLRIEPFSSSSHSLGSWFLCIEPFLIFLSFAWLLPSRLVPGHRHRHGRPAQRRRLLLPREGHVASGPAPRWPAGHRQVGGLAELVASVFSLVIECPPTETSTLWIAKLCSDQKISAD